MLHSQSNINHFSSLNMNLQHIQERKYHGLKVISF